MLGMAISAGRGLSGRLYRVDEVPEQYHEHFIVRGYRCPKSSFIQCFLSLFDPTNETLNFWTHFLPFWYFVWLTIQFSHSMDFRNDPYTWPFLCYLLGCCAFTIASAIAHLFNVMSENVRHICFFTDYAALSLFTIGSSIVSRAYCFPANFLALDNPSLIIAWVSDNFVLVSVFMSVLCTVCSCHSRFMKSSPLRKILRLSSFALPYMYQMMPIVIRLYTTQPPPSSLSFEGAADGNQSQQFLSGDYYHKRQFFLTILAAFLYASHLPERIMPGIFDIIGHSHQLFHVATILAVLDQLQSIVLDVRERKEFLLSSRWIFHSPIDCLGVFAFAFIINSIAVVYFAHKLYKTKAVHSKKKSK